MNLVTTSDQIQLVTGGAQQIAVHASFVESIGTVDSLRRQNTVITTAATTPVVSPPALHFERDVKTLLVTNEGSASEAVTVQHTDGTTAVNLLGPVTLAPGFGLYWSAYGPWGLFDPSGLRYGRR